MLTSYASGRSSLPILSVSLSSGNIDGNNNPYYFWIQARNRVGFNSPSPVRSLSIPNDSKLTIASSNFNFSNYEDWRYFIISVSTTNNFVDSRVIYRHDNYETDQITEIPATSVELNEDYILNSTGTATSFPTTNIPEGYRVFRSDLNRCYEYFSNSTRTVDNIDVLSGNTVDSRWIVVQSNSLNETAITADKELIEVTDSEFISAPLESFLNNPVPVKYYITNDSGSSLSIARLFLNESISNSSFTPTFYVTILGYLNSSRTVLDTTGIDDVNIPVLYSENSISLSKPLPSGSTFVLEIVPSVITSSFILQGSSVSLYPLLVPYIVVDEVTDWAESLADLATLKALNPIQIKNGQTRYVHSVNRKYTYSSSSSTADNGSTVIAPNGSPATGRWLAESYALANGSVTVDSLAPDVLSLFDTSIQTTTVTINAPTTYSFNLDSISEDYIILNTPLADVLNNPTILNASATLSTNETKALLVEVRQKTSVVQMDGSFTSPGGIPIVFSGNNKTDLIGIIINKDASDTIKKRAFLIQKDI